MAESEGAVEVLELETADLGSDDLKEKVGAAVSTAENLSFRFSLTVGGEAVGRPCGAEAGADATGGLMEVVLKENAEGAVGVSEGGFEAKEKPEDPEPKTAAPPREKVEQVVGIEKVKADEDDDTGAGGMILNGAVEEGAAGAAEMEGTGAPMFENAAGVGRIEAAILGGWLASEPGFGCLSPSKARAVWGVTNCLAPGLKLSIANGQSNPSVDSISITGAGGRVFSSVM